MEELKGVASTLEAIKMVACMVLSATKASWSCCSKSVCLLNLRRWRPCSQLGQTLTGGGEENHRLLIRASDEFSDGACMVL